MDDEMAVIVYIDVQVAQIVLDRATFMLACTAKATAVAGADEPLFYHMDETTKMGAVCINGIKPTIIFEQPHPHIFDQHTGTTRILPR
jgi:hypothetical protein